jgi:hypothetical protein
MGTLSMTASDLHTKFHRPPDRSSDLLGDTSFGSDLAPQNAVQESSPSGFGPSGS